MKVSFCYKAPHYNRLLLFLHLMCIVTLCMKYYSHQTDILVHISSHTSNYCSLIPRKNLSETDTRRENNILKCWMWIKCASYCHSGYVMFRDIIGGENTRVDQIIVYITWFIHRHQITCGGSGSES